MTLNSLVRELLLVVPSLVPDAEGISSSWDGDPPGTVLMSVMGKAYVRDAGGLSVKDKVAFFGAIEEVLQTSDRATTDAICTGLLEAVISEIERQGLDRASLFDMCAGPRALEFVRAWDELSQRQ